MLWRIMAFFAAWISRLLGAATVRLGVVAVVWATPGVLGERYREDIQPRPNDVSICVQPFPWETSLTRAFRPNCPNTALPVPGPVRRFTRLPVT